MTMTTDEFQTELDKQTTQNSQSNDKQVERSLNAKNSQAIIDSIGVAVKSLLKFQAQHQPKVSVTNQKLPKSIKTPDIQKVVDALENLKQPIIENKTDDTGIINAIKDLGVAISKLPTSFPVSVPVEAITVKNQPDYTKQFDSLGKAIKSIDVKPVVNITDEKSDDYTPIIEALNPVIEAIKGIKIPKVPVTDLSPLIQATTAVQDSIQNLKFPVANYILPFKDSNGRATQVQLDSSGNVPTSGGSGGSGTQYTDGSTTVTHPIGTIPIYDNAGTITAVSATNPLPVAATFSGSVSTAPTFAQNPGAGTPTAAYGLIDSSFRPQVSVATSLPAGTNVIGHTIMDSGSTTAVSNFPVTQPVSGSVTVNAGTNLNTSALSLSATQTNGNQVSQILGIGGVSIKDATAFGDAITSGVLATTDYVWNGTNYDRAYGDKTNGAFVNIKNSVTLPVSGTFFQTTQPVSAASLPLPTGASTSSLQSTGNSSLSSIDTKLSGALSVNGSTVGTASAVVNVGQQTSNTSAVQLSASSTVPTNGIIVQAISTNIASIFIGGSGVTTSNGFELQAGQSAPFTSNLNTLYVIGVNASDKVCWDVA